MPCYQVQSCSCELNNADADLLEKALQKEGFTVTRNADGLQFRKGNVTGSYKKNQISMTGQSVGGKDTDAIKRAYSEKVIERKGEQMKKKGWALKKIGPREYTMEKINMRIGG